MRNSSFPRLQMFDMHIAWPLLCVLRSFLVDHTLKFRENILLWYKILKKSVHFYSVQVFQDFDVSLLKKKLPLLTLLLWLPWKTALKEKVCLAGLCLPVSSISLSFNLFHRSSLTSKSTRYQLLFLLFYVFLLVSGQNSPRQNSPRQNSSKKADKIVPDKIVPRKQTK